MVNTTVKEFSFNCTSLTTSEVVTLAKVLYLNNTLTKLSLSSSCSLTNQQQLLLFTALSKNLNSTVKTIDLSHLSLSNSNVIVPLLGSSSLRSIVLPCRCGTTFFKYLATNNSISELNIDGNRNQLNDNAFQALVEALVEMLRINQRLLAVSLNGSMFSFEQFQEILKALVHNSALKTVQFPELKPGLTSLMLVFECLYTLKLRPIVDLRPHAIDIQNRKFSFFPNKYAPVSAEEISSLQGFLECYGIKQLTLKRTSFTSGAIIMLCDLIRLNKSLTSVDFTNCCRSEEVSDCSSDEDSFYSSGDDYIGVISFSDHEVLKIVGALQDNSTLKNVNVSIKSIGFKSLLAIFELISTGKLTSNIQVSPHSINLSLGFIR
ncbi:hypothetical protein GEMRC1_009855 [Eukaryota sp. GEM-RC1]